MGWDSYELFKVGEQGTLNPIAAVALLQWPSEACANSNHAL